MQQSSSCCDSCSPALALPGKTDTCTVSTTMLCACITKAMQCQYLPASITCKRSHTTAALLQELPLPNLNLTKIQHVQKAPAAVDCNALGSYTVAGLSQNLGHSRMQCFPPGGDQHVCLHSQAKAVVRRLQPCSFIATNGLLHWQQIGSRCKDAALGVKGTAVYATVYRNAKFCANIKSNQ